MAAFATTTTIPMTTTTTTLDVFEVGPCESAYEMGFLIGQRYKEVIQSRLSKDLILKNQLLPWALTSHSHSLIQNLSNNNRNKYPNYWNELIGLADGSGTPFLHVLLINFRKEILPFITETKVVPSNIADDAIECSDLLVVGKSIAVAAHNEDANVALLGHTYLIKATLSNGLRFISYTYAGELPSCAFGFNNFGMGFTLDSVPPSKEEIVAGGIGRNFISRDLLEATNMDDAINRIQFAEVSAGHSYNLIELSTRKIFNVETASRSRISVLEIGATPFFHANMYLHLQVNQVHDENSLSRQKRALVLAKESKDDFLALLGDGEDKKYPIYMTGPTLYTLCTALIDIDEQTLSIIQGNPRKREICHVFSLSSKDFEEIKWWLQLLRDPDWLSHAWQNPGPAACKSHEF